MIGSVPLTYSLNIDCYHIHKSFLNVTFIRSLSNNSIETLMKKKFTSPSTILPAASMTPNNIKLTTLFSELLRIRRICSKTKYVDLFDKLLEKEFTLKGYININIKITKFIKKINSDYDSRYKKIVASKKTTGLVYGATTIFDKTSNSHLIVKKILKCSLCKSDIKLPFLIPFKKMKSILQTKKRYLSKLRIEILKL